MNKPSRVRYPRVTLAESPDLTIAHISPTRPKRAGLFAVRAVVQAVEDIPRRNRALVEVDEVANTLRYRTGLYGVVAKREPQNGQTRIGMAGPDLRPALFVGLMALAREEGINSLHLSVSGRGVTDRQPAGEQFYPGPVSTEASQIGPDAPLRYAAQTLDLPDEPGQHLVVGRHGATLPELARAARECLKTMVNIPPDEGPEPSGWEREWADQSVAAAFGVPRIDYLQQAWEQGQHMRDLAAGAIAIVNALPDNY